MKDIRDKEDIRLFVHTFYDQVKMDAQLGPIFTKHISADNWPGHLERMSDFWNTVLFAQREYRGNPFAKHISLPIHAEHFKQWTRLFKGTIDSLFQGVKAEEAKMRADKMSMMFQSKLDYLRSHENYSNIM